MLRVEGEITLPTPHAGQLDCWNVIKHAPRAAVRCGRRWGKTTFGGGIIACGGAARGDTVGYFTPTYKYQNEVYGEVLDILRPIIRSKSRTDGVIRTLTRGRVDFWTLENERAGASRKYNTVIIDEAAFTKPVAMQIWQRAIEPTLLDYGGRAIVLSNTNGEDPDNFFWKLCNEPEHGFIEYHAPSTSNPDMPKRRPRETDDEYRVRQEATFAQIKAERPPLVYAQEYEAIFVSWAGVAFFEEEKLLVNREPVDYPRHCDDVFCVIDSSMKSGKQHDGTAVSYWARSQFTGIPLICLDWEIVSIDGAMLEGWLPKVLARCEELARECRSRKGSLGAFIEDAQSGTILIQQAANRRWPAKALPSTLTAAGKDGRALNASAPVYQGKVKWSRHAYDKTMNFHNAMRNHLITQVHGFRIGDKAAATRADDLLDTFTYAVGISLGNQEGFA